MAFTKPSVALGVGRTGGGDQRHTTKMEFLSPGVLIGFAPQPGGNYPTQAMKDTINAAATQARNIVRIANDMLAKVVILRRPETQLFTDTMASHLNLVAGDLAGGLLHDNIIDKPFSPMALFVHDRRWILEKVRQKMLSLSYHLNTGVYLIDQDKNNRNIFAGVQNNPNAAQYANWVGYVHFNGPQRGIKGALCGFRNGEIHVNFEDMLNYSLNTNANIIIHEAAHKFLGANSGALIDLYANDVNYPPLLQRNDGSLDNADCIAWIAVSLATGAVRMDNPNSNDWVNCPGPAL